MKKETKTKNFIVKVYIKKNLDKSYAELASVSGTMFLKVKGRPFVHLWSAVERNEEDYIEAYGQLLFMVVMLTGSDSAFDSDLVVALNAWQERTDDKAKEKAAKVTDIDEETDNRLMRDAIDIAEGGEKVRKAKADELRQQIKEVRDDG